MAADSDRPGVIVAEARRSADERIGRSGLALVYVGMAALAGCIVLRGLAIARAVGQHVRVHQPDLHVGLMAAAVVLRKPQYRALWVFVLVPVLILLTVSGRWLYTNAAPVMPALQSYWLPIHVSVVSLGSGVFLVGGVASIPVPAEDVEVRRTRTAGPAGAHGAATPRRADAGSNRLPHHDLRLPDLRFRGDFSAPSGPRRPGDATGAGIPRRRSPSSRGWSTRPYLHARSTAGWRDKKAAWINVVGFVAMVFNLFFINLVTVGLHSYAGSADRGAPRVTWRGADESVSEGLLSSRLRRDRKSDRHPARSPWSSADSPVREQNAERCTAARPTPTGPAGTARQPPGPNIRASVGSAPCLTKEAGSANSGGVGRVLIDVVLYTLARIVLVVALTAVIYYAARIIGIHDFPVVVALLFGIVLALPIGIWVLGPLRKRATASIAVVDERRRSVAIDCRHACAVNRRPRNDARHRRTSRATRAAVDVRRAGPRRLAGGMRAPSRRYPVVGDTVPTTSGSWSTT